MNEPEKNIDGLNEQVPTDLPSFTPDNFYQKAEEKPDEEAPAETPESPSEEAKPPDDVEPSEASPEEQPDDKSEGDDEEEIISSFQELVDQNEWDWDWLKSLDVNVGGQNIPFSDLVKSFKDAGATSELEKEVKAKRQAQEKEFAQQRHDLESQFVVAAKLIENAEALFNPQAQSIDWAKLREEDPAEFSAKKSEVAEYSKALEGAKLQIKEEYEKAISEKEEEVQQALLETVAKEKSRLLEVFPELADESELEERSTVLRKHLKQQGFSDKEIGHFYDHRLVVMAEHQRLWLEGQSKRAVAKKKVAKVPKVMRSGAKADKKKPRPTDAATILYGPN